MSVHKKEILNDLTKILEKMISLERQEKKNIFSDEAYVYLSYAMEHVVGMYGITDREVEKYRPDYLNSKNN